MKSAQDLLANRGTIIEVSRDEPIDVVCLALFEGHAQTGVPHLAGVDAPRIEDLGTLRHGLLAEIDKRAVISHRIVSLTIDDGDRPRVAFRFGVESSDQSVQRFQVCIMTRVLKWINDDGMDSARFWRRRLWSGSPRSCLSSRCGRRFHNEIASYALIEV